MVWVTANPQSTTKIRDLATVIPANNKAIEEGEVEFHPWSINFGSRNTYAAGVDPTQTANQFQVFSKLDPQSKLELFVQPPSSAMPTAVKYQLSRGIPKNANPGCTWLPGGLLIKWGSFVLNGSAQATVAFDTDYPFTTVLAVTLGTTSPILITPGVVSITSGTLFTTGFDAYGNVAGMSCWYIAIGN